MINLKKTLTSPPEGIKKGATKAKTAKMREELMDLHRKLYAEGKHSILVILQGLDA